MKKIISGKLKLSEEVMDDLVYLVEENGEVVNIMDILYNIYRSENFSCGLRLEANGRQLFDENDNLVKEKNKYGYYTFRIGGKDLEDVLWKNCGKMVNIEINTNEDREG